MKAARVIWIIWCLAWVLIWLALAAQSAMATATCQQINQDAGVLVESCPGGWPVLFGVAAAALSGVAIRLPVGSR